MVESPAVSCETADCPLGLRLDLYAILKGVSAIGSVAKNLRGRDPKQRVTTNYCCDNVTVLIIIQLI